MYWIDPNGGTIKDAIKVYCEKTKKSSCVYPKYSRVIDGSSFLYRNLNLSFSYFACTEILVILCRLAERYRTRIKRGFVMFS